MTRSEACASVEARRIAGDRTRSSWPREELSARLKELVGKAAPEAIIVLATNATLCEQDAAVEAIIADAASSAGSRTRPSDSSSRSRQTGSEATARIDAEIDTLKFQHEERVTEIAFQGSGRGRVGQQCGRYAIKKIEQIKVHADPERAGIPRAARSVRPDLQAGMGAEAVRELVARVDLDQLAAQLQR